MRVKYLVTGLLVLFMVSGVAGQGEAPDTAPQPDNPNGDAVIPELPSDASPVAKNVRETINDFLGGGIDNLGNALSGLLGDSQAGNMTDQ